MKRLFTCFNAFISHERGNVLIIAGFAIPMLMIAAGLAIDLNRYMKSNGYIQNAVDQAALAAVSVDGQDRTEIATRFFHASLTDDVRQYLELGGITIEESFPPGGPLSVTVSANVNITNRFGGFVGVDEVTIARRGQATRAVSNVEAVITLAASGTMCANKFRMPNDVEQVDGDTLVGLSPDEDCTDFNAMKQGVKDFLQIVDDNDTVTDFKIGLVPYNYKVKMPDLDSIPASMTRNEDNGFFNDVSDAEPLSPVLPMLSTGSDLARIRAAIEDLEQTPEGIAWSRSDLGSHVAGLMLDPSHSQYFPGGQTPAAFDNADTQKVLIMMTDGANTGCCYTNWPIGNFENQYVYSYTPYNQAQLDVCQVLKDNGVKIYSILFNVSETDPGGREINNVFARCSSGAYAERDIAENAQLRCRDKQHCYNVSDHEQLVKAYRQIAQTFYKPTITE